MNEDWQAKIISRDRFCNRIDEIIDRCMQEPDLPRACHIKDDQPMLFLVHEKLWAFLVDQYNELIRLQQQIEEENDFGGVNSDVWTEVSGNSFLPERNRDRPDSWKH